MNLKSLCIFMSVSLLFYSCDPCSKLDCLTSNYYGQFRIVSKLDGKDLVFGSSRIYDSKKIMFFSSNGTDTTFFEYSPIKFPGSGYDSILYVNFYPETDKPILMRLSDTDTDTLSIKYNSYKSKCCGDIVEIESFRYNNSIDLSGTEGTQVIRK